jgi:hypothetical protein
MRIQRLSWAGVKLQTPDVTALIDPLVDVSMLERLQDSVLVLGAANADAYETGYRNA